MDANFEFQHTAYITIRPWIKERMDAHNWDLDSFNGNPYTRHLISTKGLLDANWNILYPEMEGPSKWIILNAHPSIYECQTREGFRFLCDLLAAIQILKKAAPRGVDRKIITEQNMKDIFNDVVADMPDNDREFISEHPWSIQCFTDQGDMEPFLMETISLHKYFSECPEWVKREMRIRDDYASIIYCNIFVRDIEEHFKAETIALESLRDFEIELISSMPFALDLIEDHSDLLDWNAMAKSNPAAAFALEESQDKFDLDDILQGPNAITYNYAKIRSDNEWIGRELAAELFHPRRIDAWIRDGNDIEEYRECY